MASDESREMLRRTLGLDKPVYVQYVKWFGEVLKGNFGTSIATSLPVLDLVIPRFINTVILTIPSLVLALWIGFFVGMFAAAKPFSLFDRIGMSFTLLLGSTPPFWFGLMLVLFFALNWRIFPATGMVSMRGDGGVLDILHHLVLPSRMYHQLGVCNVLDFHYNDHSILDHLLRRRPIHYSDHDGHYDRQYKHDRTYHSDRGDLLDQ